MVFGYGRQTKAVVYQYGQSADKGCGISIRLSFSGGIYYYTSGRQEKLLSTTDIVYLGTVHKLRMRIKGLGDHLPPYVRSQQAHLSRKNPYLRKSLTPPPPTYVYGIFEWFLRCRCSFNTSTVQKNGLSCSTTFV